MEISERKVQPKDYLKKITGIFGGSETGKTRTLKTILHGLRDEVSCVFVFSGSELDDPTYSKFLPAPFIFHDMDIEKLESIYKRQQMIASMWHKANNVKTLGRLYARLRSDREKIDRLLDKLEEKRHSCERDIERKFKDDQPARTKKLQDIKNKFDEERAHILKAIVRKNRERLEGMSAHLDENERFALKYLDLRPHTIVIIDDLGPALKNVGKQKTKDSAREGDILSKLIFKGRHAFFSVFILLQSDNSIPPSLRLSLHVSIFTDEKSATSYFKRETNSVSKEDQIIARSAVNYTFRGLGRDKDARLLYLKNEKEQFWCVRIKDVGKFSICLPIVVEFGHEIEASADPIDTSNPFYSSFNTI